MTHWAHYVKERLGWEVLEREYGFIAYSISAGGKDAWIEEIYLAPEFRGGPLAFRLAEEVEGAVLKEGVSSLWGRIYPGIPGSERSLKKALSYGFKLAGFEGGAIIIKKEIGG